MTMVTLRRFVFVFPVWRTILHGVREWASRPLAMSFYKAYAVAIGSLLTGAAVVHNIYKPDLVTYRPLALNA